ncbi:DNA repair protein RecO [Sinomicrobium weinanense]|uniref:DNA repair protein RecO n=1 Tax=Sinomicrobium weinanense TaxID=2842200 RepID=A0A926JN93_9FLAO|nr:DNA repair protein RecO [Sinomicrobium weinanense]MBC9794405.1 DNA repair protein RecO [Sinomicrobium weinanense]MBU3124312.1 DNA repair protein RecO [Sinomicrobium weinanense]
MVITTKAIVLSSIKYSDASLIVKCFTECCGVKSYLLRGVLSSRKGKLKKAHFFPLTQLEITAGHKNRGGLEHIREARVYYPYRTVYSDMAKNAVVLFLAEVLNSCIQEEEENTVLYRYIEDALTWLDTRETPVNFHILFLLRLTRYLGFYPDASRSHLSYFDLLEGSFADHAGYGPVIYGEALEHFRKFLETDFDGSGQIKLTKEIRKNILNALITYFELHLIGFKKPRSLAVLHEVFD